MSDDEKKKSKFQEDWEKNWNTWNVWNKRNWGNFKKGWNDFFKMPDEQSNPEFNKTTSNIPLIEDKSSINTLQNRLEEKIVIAPEKKPPLKVWEENWNNFSGQTANMFKDMQTKINEWNEEFARNLEEKIKKGKVDYSIWVEKQQLKNKAKSEQQRLAMEKFKAWVAENNAKSQQYFTDQKGIWDNQLNTWRNDQQQFWNSAKGKWEDNAEQWKANQEKFKGDYDVWIEKRRQDALEKAKFKMKLGWRQTFNIMMALLPFIIVMIIIIVIVNLLSNFGH
jgi:hypothetical protein